MSQAQLLIDSGSPIALTSATVFPTLPGAVTGTGNAVAAPTAPNDGDRWIESNTVKVRLNGATVTVQTA